MATVLIVDDEELSRLVLRKLITRFFPDAQIVGEAENGRLAVELAQTLAPDIVLMDIKIPGVNGLDAAARIREIRPDTRILIISAYDSFGFAQRAVNAGLSGYLLKPVREEEFISLFGKAAASLPPVPLTLRTRIEGAINSLSFQELSLDRTAEVLGMSPQYLSRSFKDLFGMKFVEYITMKKIEAAKEMLKAGSPTVPELCSRLGWSDTAHFTRLFKEQTGHSPKAWGNALRSGAGEEESGRKPPHPESGS